MIIISEFKNESPMAKRGIEIANRMKDQIDYVRNCHALIDYGKVEHAKRMNKIAKDTSVCEVKTVEIWN